MTNELLGPDAFVDRLRKEGAPRYHNLHPFHTQMHAGKLSKQQIRAWVSK